MNFGELKTAVADWLMRTDLAPALPTLVRLAESRLNKELRVRQMVVRASSLAQDSFVLLPGDFLEAMNVQFNHGPLGVVPLSYVSMEEADKIRARGLTEPRHFTIIGNELEIVPRLREDKEIELIYYAKIPIMVNDQDKNWLLELWPDIYLYGVLVESAPYLHADDRAGLWGELYSRAMEAARLSDWRAQSSGSTLQVKARPIG